MSCHTWPGKAHLVGSQSTRFWSIGLWSGLSIWTSNRSSGDTDAAGLRNALWEPLL
jgi:hypothetical protein